MDTVRAATNFAAGWISCIVALTSCVCVLCGAHSLREGEQFVRPSLARDASKREEVWGATSTIKPFFVEAVNRSVTIDRGP